MNQCDISLIARLTAPSLQPNNASQLSSGWAIHVCLFYPKTAENQAIDPRKLALSIERGLLSELPHLCGRWVQEFRRVLRDISL